MGALMEASRVYMLPTVAALLHRPSPTPCDSRQACAMPLYAA